jgi:5-deoxy-glucuronate isomerase
VPLNYFNIVKLKQGEAFDLPGAGLRDLHRARDRHGRCRGRGRPVRALGGRGEDVWDGEPQGVYVPTGAKATMVCTSGERRGLRRRGKYDEVLEPFDVRDTRPRAIRLRRHQDPPQDQAHPRPETGGKVGRLLVSELYTVGAGGWSGFPSHKHDTDRLPDETHHDETYNFRFKPNWGSGLQMLQREDGKPGDAYHIVDGSTICIDKGYHPCACCRATRCTTSPSSAGEPAPLVQYFQPTHAYQIETIPGIKDMIAKFK